MFIFTIYHVFKLLFVFFLFGTTCPLCSHVVGVSGSYHEASSHRSVFEKIAENATTAGQLLYYYRIRGELFQYYSGVSCSAEITWFSCLSVRFCLFVFFKRINLHDWAC